MDSSNEHVLRRLLELSKAHTDVDAQTEQRDLVLKLASNLDVNVDESVGEVVSSPAEEHTHEVDDVKAQVKEDHEDHHEQSSPEVSHEHTHHAEEHPDHHEHAHVKDEDHHEEVIPKEKPHQVEPTAAPTPAPAKEKASPAPTNAPKATAAKVEEKPVAKQVERRVAEPRKSSPAQPRASAGAGGSTSPAGGSECDLSDPKIAEAYEDVRDDNTESNWMLLGYGSSKKALQLYGHGSDGLKGFVTRLPDNEVAYGYIRMKYGDSARSKFVFVTYVPENLSGLSKAKANMHKPSVDSFLKYHHVQVNATSTSDLQEANIQAKLTAASGANYGTGGAAPAGSENFGNIKSNAKQFFSDTEKKGSVSISYNKDPLSSSTPVSLSGRAGITEKYIKTLST